MFDAESLIASDLADFACRHAVLSRNCEKGGKIFRCERNDGAGAAFTEESVFRRCIVIQMNIHAESGRGKPRPYGIEAGLGEGDGEAAVGNVVRGFKDAFGSQRDETINQAFFGGKVEGWRVAGDDATDGFRKFGGGEFAGEGYG